MAKSMYNEKHKKSDNNISNSTNDKSTFTIKDIITFTISIIALVFSFVSCTQNIQNDNYNRKTSKFSYYYDIIDNDKSCQSSLEFVLENNEEKIIKVTSPKKIRMKVTAGMPAKRKIILLNLQQGNSAPSIRDIKTFNSAEGTSGLKNEDLEFYLCPNNLPAYKIEENQYLSYYFIYSEGVDGYKSIDCVIYQILKGGKDENEYQASINIMDSIDLGLRMISIKEDDQNIEYNYSLRNFFEDHIFNGYDFLSKKLKAIY